MSYWDTSCLIKLYTPEHDSDLLRGFLASGDACVTCDIASLEFWATLRRKESEGILAPGDAQKVQNVLEADIACAAIIIKTCGAVVRARFKVIVNQCYALQPPIFIRINEALHLAAAHCAGETEIVTTDKRLREAALALNFLIFPIP